MTEVIVGRGGESDNRALLLYTKKRRFVANEMPIQRSLDGLRSVCEAIERNFSAKLLSASTLYNCYGLAFASRRTAIMDSDEVQKFLDDDGYVEMPWDANMWGIGDIVLYHAADDPVSHVAVVHDFVRDGTGDIVDVMVVSAWGLNGEYLHRIDPKHQALGTPYRVKSQRQSL